MDINNQNNNQELTKKERRELRRQEKDEQRSQAAKKRKARRLITWLVVILVLGGAVWGLTKIPGQETDTDGSQLSLPVGDLDQIKGNVDSGVILVEYSDFQCPACAAYFPLLEQLSDEFGDRMAFVYRHFPLRSIHPNAEPAAKAAEAAGLQGKFWEMHDLLFENQTTWSSSRDAEDIFTGYAQLLGLDVDRFKEDMDLGEIDDKIDDHVASGNNSGVNGTPSFFLNGRKILNPQSLDEFRQIIAGALADTGVSPSTSEPEPESTQDSNE